MKKLLISMCFCLFLFSCSGSTIDQLKSIRREFKQDCTSICVLPITGEFIAKDVNSDLWFIRFNQKSMLMGLPPVDIKHRIQFDMDIKKELDIKIGEL